MDEQKSLAIESGVLGGLPAQVSSSALVESVSRRVAPFLETFIKNQNSDATKREYEKDIARFSEFLAEHRPGLRSPRELSIHDIVEYRDYLTGKRHNAPVTVNRRLAVLSAFFKFLMSQGLMAHDPTYGVKRPGVEHRRKTVAFSREQVAQMLKLPDLETITGLRDHALLCLAFNTAARSAALLRVRPTDFAIVDGFRIVRLWEKGGKPHEIKINAATWASIERYLSAMEKAGHRIGSHDPMFQGNPRHAKARVGHALHPTTLDYLIKKYAALVGVTSNNLRRISPHTTRKTTATILLEDGEPIDSVQRMLNHARITTTQKYDLRLHSLAKRAEDNLPFFETESISEEKSNTK